MTNLNWAMVGTGLMAELILEDFALAADTNLYALVSRDPDKAKARLAEFKIEAKALTFEQALADPEIDVIYIASPHSEHFWQAKAALEAGKQVLVEKAFTMSAKEAEELDALAKSKGLFLMEAMWTKFLPLHNALKAIIESGELGKLVSIEANFGKIIEFDNNHRLYNFELGGGTTLDQGVYTTTFNRWMSGSNIASQTTFGHRFSNGSDAHADTTFVFENGVIGHGITSLDGRIGFNARVFGSVKSVELVGSFWNAQELDVLSYDVQSEPTRERRSYKTIGAGYTHMLQAVSAAIKAGKTQCDEHPVSWTIENMKVLDQIRSNIK
jgi:predicted dehydrogenase